MAAVLFRPGHAEPALRSHFARELRVEGRLHVAATWHKRPGVDLLPQERANVYAQRIGLRWEGHGVELKLVGHGAFPRSFPLGGDLPPALKALQKAG